MSEETEGTTSPWEPDKAYFRVVLKGGPGYEDSWVNIGAGTPARFKQAVADFFGWELKDDDTAVDLAVRATEQWHALNNINREFPGTERVRNTRGRSAARDRAFSGQQEQQPAEPPDPKKVLIEQINAAGASDDLRGLYADNKELFEDADVLAAYKTRGKALMSEGK